jgi:hypothetical protein
MPEHKISTDKKHFHITYSISDEEPNQTLSSSINMIQCFSNRNTDFIARF